jgi:hypothetical protein
MLGSNWGVGEPAMTCENGTVSLIAPMVGDVPTTYCALKNRVSFNRQYCPLVLAPVDVTPVQDGVNAVHAPMAFMLAAVKVAPDTRGHGYVAIRSV